jgi:hypothetical protein
MNAAGEVIDNDDDAYNYEEDIQRMHVLFEAYLFYEQVTPSQSWCCIAQAPSASA